MFVAWMSAAGALLILSGCEDEEARAREALTRQGYTAIELTEDDDGAFRVTAKKGGRACQGAIGIGSDQGSRTVFTSVPCTLPEGVAELEALCAGGDLEACAKAGLAYSRGEGVSRDVAHAVRDYQKACDGGEGGEGGVEEACHNLGVLLSQGDGVPRDPTRALAAFRRGCSLGLAIACSAEADLLAESDPVAARPLLERRCQASEETSCLELGILLRADRGGAAPDFVGAAAAFRRGCDQGSARACVMMSYMLDHAEGGPRDRPQALVLARKACSLGEPSGCTNAEILERSAARRDDNP